MSVDVRSEPVSQDKILASGAAPCLIGSMSMMARMSLAALPYEIRVPKENHNVLNTASLCHADPNGVYNGFLYIIFSCQERRCRKYSVGSPSATNRLAVCFHFLPCR